jgi:hypothetical protein
VCSIYSEHELQYTNILAYSFDRWCTAYEKHPHTPATNSTLVKLSENLPPIDVMMVFSIALVHRIKWLKFCPRCGTHTYRIQGEGINPSKRLSVDLTYTYVTKWFSEDILRLGLRNLDKLSQALATSLVSFPNTFRDSADTRQF